MHKERLVLALDASQISEALTCLRSWYLRYNQHLVRTLRKKTALDKGTYMHKLCDLYYNLRAMNPSENSMVHSKAVLDLINSQRIELDLTKEDFEMLRMRFFQYTIRYMQNDFKVKTKNGIPAVELGFSKVLYEDADYLFVVEGRIDSLGSYANIPMFIDHKTQEKASWLYKYCPQFLTYAWATGLNYGLINYIRLHKEVTSKTFERQVHFFPTWRIKAWEKQMLQVFFQIARMHDFYSPDAGNTKSCGGAFNSVPCMFTHICENPDKRDLIILQNYEKRVWNPWESAKEDETTEEEVYA